MFTTRHYSRIVRHKTISKFYIDRYLFSMLRRSGTNNINSVCYTVYSCQYCIIRSNWKLFHSRLLRTNIGCGIDNKYNFLNIVTSLPRFGPCLSVCMSVCLCVCVSVCLCVRPIFWYFIYRILEEIEIDTGH